MSTAVASVGIVTPERITIDKPLTLECGRVLPSHELMVETYGTLNSDKSNALLICHALSGDHHAAGKYSADDNKAGWWDNCIGPGLPIDTNKFFVVSLNNLGGCNGSTGPKSICPETGKVFGPDFPFVTVKDWVKSQSMLADHLGIKKWSAVIGGSLGGMQALQWAIDLPDRVANSIVIAAAPKLSAQNIAFNEIARQSIFSDPDYHDGRYADHGVVPQHGLKLARMLGHITYLSDDAMRAKFGRELRSGGMNFNYEVEFEVESYLRYQGKQFVDRFDANSYLLMTKALDYFDPAREYDNDLSKAVERSSANFLVMSFEADWRFSPKRSEELVYALISARKNVSYVRIASDLGHDDFLMPLPEYHRALGDYLSRVARQFGSES